MSFKEIQKEKTAQIEQILKAYLPRVQGYQEVIMDAMSYSMLAGGKRLRYDALDAFGASPGIGADAAQEQDRKSVV